MAFRRNNKSVSKKVKVKVTGILGKSIQKAHEIYGSKLRELDKFKKNIQLECKVFRHTITLIKNNDQQKKFTYNLECLLLQDKFVSDKLFHLKKEIILCINAQIERFRDSSSRKIQFKELNQLIFNDLPKKCQNLASHLDFALSVLTFINEFYKAELDDFEEKIYQDKLKKIIYNEKPTRENKIELDIAWHLLCLSPEQLFKYKENLDNTAEHLQLKANNVYIRRCNQDLAQAMYCNRKNEITCQERIKLNSFIAKHGDFRVHYLKITKNQHEELHKFIGDEKKRIGRNVFKKGYKKYLDELDKEVKNAFYRDYVCNNSLKLHKIRLELAKFIKDEKIRGHILVKCKFANLAKGSLYTIAQIMTGDNENIKNTIGILNQIKRAKLSKRIGVMQTCYSLIAKLKEMKQGFVKNKNEFQLRIVEDRFNRRYARTFLQNIKSKKENFKAIDFSKQNTLAERLKEKQKAAIKIDFIKELSECGPDKQKMKDIKLKIDDALYYCTKVVKMSWLKNINKKKRLIVLQKLINGDVSVFKETRDGKFILKNKALQKNKYIDGAIKNIAKYHFDRLTIANSSEQVRVFSSIIKDVKTNDSNKKLDAMCKKIFSKKPGAEFIPVVAQKQSLNSFVTKIKNIISKDVELKGIKSANNNIALSDILQKWKLIGSEGRAQEYKNIDLHINGYLEKYKGEYAQYGVVIAYLALLGVVKADHVATWIKNRLGYICQHDEYNHYDKAFFTGVLNGVRIMPPLNHRSRKNEYDLFNKNIKNFLDTHKFNAPAKLMGTWVKIKPYVNTKNKILYDNHNQKVGDIISDYRRKRFGRIGKVQLFFSKLNSRGKKRKSKWLQIRETQLKNIEKEYVNTIKKVDTEFTKVADSLGTRKESIEKIKNFLICLNKIKAEINNADKRQRTSALEEAIVKIEKKLSEKVKWLFINNFKFDINVRFCVDSVFDVDSAFKEYVKEIQNYGIVDKNILKEKSFVSELFYLRNKYIKKQLLLLIDCFEGYPKRHNHTISETNVLFIKHLADNVIKNEKIFAKFKISEFTGDSCLADDVIADNVLDTYTQIVRLATNIVREQNNNQDNNTCHDVLIIKVKAVIDFLESKTYRFVNSKEKKEFVDEIKELAKEYVKLCLDNRRIKFLSYMSEKKNVLVLTCNKEKKEDKEIIGKELITADKIIDGLCLIDEIRRGVEEKPIKAKHLLFLYNNASRQKQNNILDAVKNMVLQLFDKDKGNNFSDIERHKYTLNFLHRLVCENNKYIMQYKELILGLRQKCIDKIIDGVRKIDQKDFSDDNVNIIRKYYALICYLSTSEEFKEFNLFYKDLSLDIYLSNGAKANLENTKGFEICRFVHKNKGNLATRPKVGREYHERQDVVAYIYDVHFKDYQEATLQCKSNLSRDCLKAKVLTSMLNTLKLGLIKSSSSLLHKLYPSTKRIDNYEALLKCLENLQKEHEYTDESKTAIRKTIEIVTLLIENRKKLPFVVSSLEEKLLDEHVNNFKLNSCCDEEKILYDKLRYMLFLSQNIDEKKEKEVLAIIDGINHILRDDKTKNKYGEFRKTYNKYYKHLTEFNIAKCKENSVKVYYKVLEILNNIKNYSSDNIVNRKKFLLAEMSDQLFNEISCDKFLFILNSNQRSKLRFAVKKIIETNNSFKESDCYKRMNVIINKSADLKKILSDQGNSFVISKAELQKTMNDTISYYYKDQVAHRRIKEMLNDFLDNPKKEGIFHGYAKFLQDIKIPKNDYRDLLKQVVEQISAISKMDKPIIAADVLEVLGELIALHADELYEKFQHAKNDIEYVTMENAQEPLRKKKNIFGQSLFTKRVKKDSDARQNIRMSINLSKKGKSDEINSLVHAQLSHVKKGTRDEAQLKKALYTMDEESRHNEVIDKKVQNFVKTLDDAKKNNRDIGDSLQKLIKDFCEINKSGVTRHRLEVFSKLWEYCSQLEDYKKKFVSKINGFKELIMKQQNENISTSTTKNIQSLCKYCDGIIGYVEKNKKPTVKKLKSWQNGLNKKAKKYLGKIYQDDKKYSLQNDWKDIIQIVGNIDQVQKAMRSKKRSLVGFKYSDDLDLIKQYMEILLRKDIPTRDWWTVLFVGYEAEEKYFDKTILTKLNNEINGAMEKSRNINSELDKCKKIGVGYEKNMLGCLYLALLSEKIAKLQVKLSAAKASCNKLSERKSYAEKKCDELPICRSRYLQQIQNMLEYLKLYGKRAYFKKIKQQCQCFIDVANNDCQSNSMALLVKEASLPIMHEEERSIDNYKKRNVDLGNAEKFSQRVKGKRISDECNKHLNSYKDLVCSYMPNNMSKLGFFKEKKTNDQFLAKKQSVGPYKSNYCNS